MLTREKEINIMNNQITIQKENILNAYNQASGEQKSLLENLFGKDMFQPKNIMERVKTFEDAALALSLIPYLEPCFIISGFSSFISSNDGAAIP